MIWGFCGVLFGVFLVVFCWPWVDVYAQRRDVPQRLLDRLQEEWEREEDAPPRFDGRPW